MLPTPRASLRALTLLLAGMMIASTANAQGVDMCPAGIEWEVSGPPDYENRCWYYFCRDDSASTGWCACGVGECSCDCPEPSCAPGGDFACERDWPILQAENCGARYCEAGANAPNYDFLIGSALLGVALLLACCVVWRRTIEDESDDGFGSSSEDERDEDGKVEGDEEDGVEVGGLLPLRSVTLSPPVCELNSSVALRRTRWPTQTKIDSDPARVRVRARDNKAVPMRLG